MRRCAVSSTASAPTSKEGAMFFNSYYSYRLYRKSSSEIRGILEINDGGHDILFFPWPEMEKLRPLFPGVKDKEFMARMVWSKERYSASEPGFQSVIGS